MKEVNNICLKKTPSEAFVVACALCRSSYLFKRTLREYWLMKEFLLTIERETVGKLFKMYYAGARSIMTPLGSIQSCGT